MIAIKFKSVFNSLVKFYFHCYQAVYISSLSPTQAIFIVLPALVTSKTPFYWMDRRESKMKKNLTNHMQRLSTQTIPEILAPKACTLSLIDSGVGNCLPILVCS